MPLWNLRCNDGIPALCLFSIIQMIVLSNVQSFIPLHRQHRTRYIPQTYLSGKYSCRRNSYYHQTSSMHRGRDVSQTQHNTAFSSSKPTLYFMTTTPNETNIDNANKSFPTPTSATTLADLYECLGAFSSAADSNEVQEPLLSLSCGTASCPEEENERGILVTQNVKRDSILLCIPLSSCLCDDSPPDWFYAEEPSSETNSNPSRGSFYNTVEDDILDSLITDNTNHHLHNPSQWAIRLAASLLDLQTTCTKNNTSKNVDNKDNMRLTGLCKWLSMSPDPSLLRASLPVHWSDEALSKARCCALELAVDSAYFARAEAVDALLDGLRRRSSKRSRISTNIQNPVNVPVDDELEDEGMMASKCHSALDFVQTRVCRVDRLNGLHPPMRLLVPIFDFINHGGSTGARRANASFRLEQQPDISKSDDEDEAFLVVRASRDMGKGEEVLINYGKSARPAWKCLASYGFVPAFDEEDDDEDDDNANIAEVFMDGMRYEVGKNTVPMEMVIAAAETMASENGDYDVNAEENTDKETNEDENEIGNSLTPQVALRIAKRVSDVAFDLLLENAHTNVNTNTDQGEFTNEEEDHDDDGESAAEIHASSLAASLRYSQHRVLMSCAMGLRDYAAQNMNN